MASVINQALFINGIFRSVPDQILVLSQLGFSICLRKRTIRLSCLVGSVVGGGGSDGPGQVRSAVGAETTGRTPASDSGWETPGPSHRAPGPTRRTCSGKERRCTWNRPIDIALPD